MRLATLGVCSLALMLLVRTEARSYTATAGGYTVIDSDEVSGPAFAWDDIATTGTPITFSSSDLAFSEVTLPFAFTFFGTSYTSAWITTKGYVTFTFPTTVIYANTTLPTSSVPNNMIAAFWDSLRVTASTPAPPLGEARWQVLGTAPNRRVVFLWKDFTHNSGTSRRMTFQLALYEGSNAFRIQYLHMSNGSGTINYAGGSSATIGIEDATGTTGLQYLYNGIPSSNLVIGGLAIGFLPDGSTAPWQTTAAPDILAENFDGAPGPWTFTSPSAPIQWDVDDTPTTVVGGSSFSAPHSLNFNDDVDYTDPTGTVIPTGSATSPMLDLTGTTYSLLRFRCNYDTEGWGTTNDQRWVEISNDDFATTQFVGQLATSGATGIGICSLEGSWHEHLVPLNAAWGGVKVRFRFDAVTATNNANPGWFVDDVRVSAYPPPPPPVISPTGEPASSGTVVHEYEDRWKHKLCGGSVDVGMPWGMGVLGMIAMVILIAARRK